MFDAIASILVKVVPSRGTIIVDGGGGVYFGVVGTDGRIDGSISMI